MDFGFCSIVSIILLLEDMEVDKMSDISESRENILKIIKTRFGFIPLSDEEVEELSVEELAFLAFMDESDIKLY